MGSTRHGCTATYGSTPERTRTSNPRFRRPMLYPIELRAQSALSSEFRSCAPTIPYAVLLRRGRTDRRGLGGTRSPATMIPTAAGDEKAPAITAFGGVWKCERPRTKNGRLFVPLRVRRGGIAGLGMKESVPEMQPPICVVRAIRDLRPLASRIGLRAEQCSPANRSGGY